VLSDKIRGLIWDEQCDRCGLDIEMGSFTVINDDKNMELLLHDDCYEEFLIDSMNND
jgi:hypothetical protein